MKKPGQTGGEEGGLPWTIARTNRLHRIGWQERQADAQVHRSTRQLLPIDYKVRYKLACVYDGFVFMLYQEHSGGRAEAFSENRNRTFPHTH